jgi:FixJ family two-component response regulator
MSRIVFIVDDDPAVLKALERFLQSAGFEVQSFLSSKAFLEQHDPSVPGCLLLDVAMPEINGLEVQAALAAANAERMIVFITGREDVRAGVRAMRAGAVHFLTKPVANKELLEAIEEALRRDSLARSERAQITLVRKRLATLTPREREVLDHVIAGHLNKQIAAKLGTVEKTVTVHRSRVMQKMGVQSLAELVRTIERFRFG